MPDNTNDQKWYSGFLNQMGEGINNIAGQLPGAIFGLAMEGHNDRRQIRQQQKLTDMQKQAQIDLMGYGMDLQYDMWNKTNYDAQVGQLEKAGLNPALLYGKGGGGGATTGSASGSIGGGSAASQAGETMAGMQMGLQLEMMKAQKENIEADTANKLAENPYYQEKGPNLTMDSYVKDEQQRGMKFENDLKQWLIQHDPSGNETNDKGASMAAESKRQELNKLAAEANKAINDPMNSEEGRIAAVQKLQAEAVVEALKKGLTEQQTEAIRKGIEQRDKEISIQQLVANANIENKDQDQIIGLITNILNLVGGGIIGGILKRPNKIPSTIRTETTTNHKGERTTRVTRNGQF